MKRDWQESEREKWPLRPGFRRNTGEPPRGAKEKRAIVGLMNGELAGAEPVSPTSPVGWAVKSTRWTLTGFWADIDQYKIV